MLRLGVVVGLLVLASGCVFPPHPLAQVDLRTRHDGTQDEWNRGFTAGMPARGGVVEIEATPIPPMDDVALPAGDEGCRRTSVSLDCPEAGSSSRWTVPLTPSFGRHYYPLEPDGALHLRMRFPTHVGLQVVGEPDESLTAGLPRPDDWCGWKYVVTGTDPPLLEPEGNLPFRPGFRVDGDRDVEIRWHIEPMRNATHAIIRHSGQPGDAYEYEVCS